MAVVSEANNEHPFGRATTPRRVLIAGGGIGGLTAALCLHAAGHDVTVFESVREPRELGVGINVQPHSVRILHELGLGPALDEVAIHTRRLSFYSEDGTQIWTEDRGTHAGLPWPQYSIHRGRFQMVLLEAARERLGADRVLTGHHLSAFEQDASGVTGYFVDKETGAAAGSYTGDVLVGADGINSVVRSTLNPDQGPPHYSGLMLWRGAVEAEPFGDGESMFMAGHDTLKVVAYPIGGAERRAGRSLINWVAEFPVELDIESADWNRIAEHDDFAPAFKDWVWDWIDIPSIFAATETVWEFPMSDRDPIDRWSHGRVTLLGDAAHVMRPNGSNGSSQAIIDGESLTAALNVEDDVVDALERYQDERLPPTRQLTLDNRQTGPERVLQWVKDRCDGNCVGHHVCVPRHELETVANAYKMLAGMSNDQLLAKIDEAGAAN